MYWKSIKDVTGFFETKIFIFHKHCTDNVYLLTW